MYLGITSEEFWRLTPRQFLLLADVKRQEIHRQEYGPAMICAMMSALVGDRRSPTDFMPSLAEPRKEQTWQEKQEILGAMMSALGGKHGNAESG